MNETGTKTGNGAAQQRRPSASEEELIADLKPTSMLEHMDDPADGPGPRYDARLL